MDFLNKSLAQLKDLFASMTPGARITAALLLAVVVISLGYLFTHEIAGPDVYLLSGEMFSSTELNNMAAAFSQEGLDSFKIEGNQVRVPRNQRDKYLAALAKHDALPEEFDEVLTRAVDAGGGFESPADREARLKIARQKYLSRLLSAWPGIERASVVYDTRRQPGLSREMVVTASVQVKPRANEPLDPAVISSIRKAIVSSIAGLKPEHCAVTDMYTMRTTLGDAEGYASPNDDAYIARKQHYEQEYKNKILEALNWIAGVTVTPYAELNEELKHQEEEVKHDAKGTVQIQQSEMSVERTRESAAPGGRPGIIAQNRAQSLAASAAKGTSETETQTETTQQSLPSTKRTTTATAGLTLKRVTVAVTVPTGYFERVWRRENPTPAGQEPKSPQPSDLEPIRTQTIARIKELVATILPTPADGTDPKSLVTVAEFPDIAPPEIPEPGLAENILVWLSNSWSTLGLIAVVLFSLAMLRSMIRAVPAVESEARAPAAAVAGETAEEAETPQKATRRRQLKRFGGSGASLRDELSELVGDDPETAANILRNWIGSAT